MLYIEGNIENEDYQRLIDKAFEECDAVMFICCDYGDKAYRAKLREYNATIQQYKLLSKHVTSWPSTMTEDKTNVYIMQVYALCAELKEVLLSTSNGIFDWGYPEKPEDISFFKDGRCWLFTSTHEKDCCIYGNNRQDRLWLNSMGIEYSIWEDNKLFTIEY